MGAMMGYIFAGFLVTLAGVFHLNLGNVVPREASHWVTDGVLATCIAVGAIVGLWLRHRKLKRLKRNRRD